LQRLLIDEVHVACRCQIYRCHFVATEPTHIHVLVSWPDDRPWERARTGLKTSLTRRLNRHAQRRSWFCEGASRKRLKDRGHFDYLVGEYLPSHGGWKWQEGEGFFL
jgi:REP element-mobilizing transposase RayT